MEYFCSPAVCWWTMGSPRSSSECQGVPLRCKTVLTAAFADSTSVPMRTSQICRSYGGKLPTPWQRFVGLFQAWSTSLVLRAAQPHCSWASAEATTRERPPTCMHSRDVQHAPHTSCTQHSTFTEGTLHYAPGAELSTYPHPRNCKSKGADHQRCLQACVGWVELPGSGFRPAPARGAGTCLKGRGCISSHPRPWLSSAPAPASLLILPHAHQQQLPVLRQHLLRIPGLSVGLRRKAVTPIWVPRGDNTLQFQRQIQRQPWPSAACVP